MCSMENQLSTINGIWEDRALRHLYCWYTAWFWSEYSAAGLNDLPWLSSDISSFKKHVSFKCSQDETSLGQHDLCPIAVVSSLQVRLCKTRNCVRLYDRSYADWCITDKAGEPQCYNIYWSSIFASSNIWIITAVKMWDFALKLLTPEELCHCLWSGEHYISQPWTCLTLPSRTDLFVNFHPRKSPKSHFTHQRWQISNSTRKIRLVYCHWWIAWSTRLHYNEVSSLSYTCIITQDNNLSLP